MVYTVNIPCALDLLKDPYLVGIMDIVFDVIFVVAKDTLVLPPH